MRLGDSEGVARRRALLCWGEIEECFVNFPLKSLAVLALALGLAGCGVKGALEPPPHSGIKPNAASEAPPPPAMPTAIGTPVSPGFPAQVNRGVGRGTTSEAVVNAPSAQRSSALDWLID